MAGICDPGRGEPGMKLRFPAIVEPLYCGHLGDLVKCPGGVLISGVTFY